MHLDRLEISQPLPVCDIKVGTFYWTTKDGEKCDAEFWIRTCDASDQSKQVNDYNEQYTDEYLRLLQDGATNIIYLPVTPDPIF